MRMFDIHEDNWSLGFLFLQLVIHIDFNIVLTFEMEPKQGNVENVNWFKNEAFLFYWISDISSKGACTYYVINFCPILDPPSLRNQDNHPHDPQTPLK